MKKILFALIAILGFVSCEESGVITPQQTLKLSVDNTEIYANGVQTATFTVTDGEDVVVEDAAIYFEATNEPLDGKTFTTKYAGEYSFYAMSGNVKSNVVKVVAKEVTEDTKVVTLSATYSEDGLFVGDSATFTVDCNGDDVTAESVIYNAADDSELDGVAFTSEEAGEFVFYAVYSDVKSNNVTLTFATKENTDTPEDPEGPEQPAGELILSVEPATIYADGQEKAVFSLKDGDQEVADFEVYNAADDSKLAGKEFSTTEPAVYEFYAMVDEGKSNTVKVTARMKIVEEQKPVVLSADKDTLKANGVDTIVFSVEQDGANISNSAAIYINGGKLNGNKFATTSHGTYVAYAEYNGVKSNEITITAEEVTATGTSIVFADGVTLTSGWYDVNKKSTPQSAGADAMMCWAASSSNIAQWFQDRYVAAGNTLPAGCPNGTSSTYGYELQIMDVFRDNWDNLGKGGWPDGGVIWYLEGRDLYTTNGTEYRAYPRSGTGGYFKSQWSGIVADMYMYEDLTWGFLYGSKTYIPEINNSNWRGSTVANPLLKFSEYIIEAFEYGMSSMAVAMSSNFNGAHAVTIWGYEVDNVTGYVTKLYIADSDDGSTPVLQPYTVSADNGNAKVVLKGYATYYPFALFPMAGYASAKN